MTDTRVLISKLLKELTSVIEITDKQYIIRLLYDYVRLLKNEEYLSLITNKFQFITKENFETKLPELFERGSGYLITALINIYNSLDEVNKSVVWDYHSVIIDINIQNKKNI